MSRESRVIEAVVFHHVEETAALSATRALLYRAPHVRLEALARADARLVAHIDGLAVAGESAWPACSVALEDPGPGEIFAAVVCAIADRAPERLAPLVALGQESAELESGLLAALGWLKRDELRGIVAGMLESDQPYDRHVALRTCALHGVDPGLAAKSYVRDDDARVRASALKAAGELGVRELASVCVEADRSEDSEVRFFGARSAMLLERSTRALASLTGPEMLEGAHASEATTLALMSVSTTAGHELLTAVAQGDKKMRVLVHGTGIIGDAKYVPWLIKHMADNRLARLAGESFSLITGADLSALGLDRPQPEDFQSGPTDDPDDDNVDMDPDDGLPWPEPEKVEAWWAANASRFQKGTRHFMGAPVTRAHCIDVLKNGYQRQRILAAHYLCLLDPGTPLFNTSAPAWRQQRLLARM